MKILDKDYCLSHEEEIIDAIKGGKIFIYPTDTIYGLGGRADRDDVVLKIREVKQRDTRPMSVVAPSQSWILENCEVKIEDLDKYLPGPYTLFLKRKNISAVSREVNLIDDTLGVRMPDHWFTALVEKAGVPFITTSVNISGEKYMERLEDIPGAIIDDVDYVIYDGPIIGKPSTKVNLTN